MVHTLGLVGTSRAQKFDLHLGDPQHSGTPELCEW